MFIVFQNIIVVTLVYLDKSVLMDIFVFGKTVVHIYFDHEGKFRK